MNNLNEKIILIPTELIIFYVSNIFQTPQFYNENIYVFNFDDNYAIYNLRIKGFLNEILQKK